MVTPSKRNAFLHKMLKKSDDESEEHVSEGVSSPKLEQFLYKTRWMKKFNLNSPGKLSLPVNSPQNFCPEVVSDRQLTPTTPISDEMQDLQRIRRDFETEFSSPRKGHNEASPFRAQKFVKRMVAALEQKYNGYREMKVDKTESKVKSNTVNATGEFQMRKSYLNETFVIRQQRRSSKRLSDSPERPAYFEDHERSDITEQTFVIEEGSLRKVKPPPDDKHHHVALKKKDQKHQQHLELESPRQRSDSMIKRENAPKIIGALLKKPIEVEETEIDWIPIMNQKLPRKSSFKKLLMLLTGKRNPSKGSKLYCSQPKPCDEPKEPGDSGYDEKSSSSSSLSSGASAELPKHHQKNLSTFFSPPKSTESSQHQQDFKDDKFTPGQKFIFEQVPLSEVRLSLGPCSPNPPKLEQPMEKSPSKDSETTSINTSNSSSPSPVFPLPKHPFVSPLPKHPSASQICKDNSIMSIEEFSQSDLRRMPSWKFPSSEVIYDTPRNYLSVSNPDLVIRDKYITSNFKCNNEIIYDYPRNHITTSRPKSSVYEDCLSLQRRIADFGSSITIRSTNFYASPDEPEIYATVKPRNSRVLPSQQLLRSMAETEQNQLKAPYLVNSFFPQQTTIL